MSQKSSVPPARVPAEKLVRDIRRATRKHHFAEDKIRIVLEGLRGEESTAALCRSEAIAESLYPFHAPEPQLAYRKVALNPNICRHINSNARARETQGRGRQLDTSSPELTQPDWVRYGSAKEAFASRQSA